MAKKRAGLPSPNSLSKGAPSTLPAVTTPARRWIIPEPRNRLTQKQIRDLFVQQDGRCANCLQDLTTKGAKEIEFIDEHVAPLWRGGTNQLSNRQLWCKLCSGDKTSEEATQRAKSNRIITKQIGMKKRKGPPMLGSKASGYKRKMDGTVVKRER